MSEEAKQTTLPYRSACRCPCHRTGAMHAAPCCRPDPALETADDERGMRDCKCMPGRQCGNTGCSEETTGEPMQDMEADARKLAALLRRMIAAFNRLDVGQALMALPPDVHGECCAAMREALGALEDDI